MKSKFTTALHVILGFVIGVFLTVQTWVYSEGNQQVPHGIWSPVLMLRGISYQVNISTAEFKNEDSATFWIREDRAMLFESETSLTGKTIISHVTVDCKNQTLELLEQRAFGDTMQFLGSRDGKLATNMNTVMPLVVFVELCGIIPDDYKKDNGDTQKEETKKQTI